MTQGLVRYQNSGEFRFVTFSCYGRRPYLGLPDARGLSSYSLEAVSCAFVASIGHLGVEVLLLAY